MLVTAGVGRAGKVLPAMFADFEIISDPLAVRVITKKQAIRWMCQAKILHELLRCLNSTIGWGIG